jgi:predicted TIM-barrel fold metal-dependent hydrolase
MEETGNMEFIDTHVHVIEMSRLRYPWLDGFDALRKDFPFAVWQAEAKRCGITGALHMEVDVAEADIEAETDMVAQLMREPGSILRGAISACRPEDVNFPHFLERQIANPVVKGFRRVLHVMPDDHSESTTFRENIKRLGGAGLPFDLVVLPHQIPKAIALADLAPHVQFVLDHCGVPDIKGEAYNGWAKGITEIAKRPNVVGKLSGIVAYTDTGSWTLDTIRPYAEHTINSFGFDRMVWGSDWPVCTLGGSLSTWVGATHALFEGTSKDEKHALLAGNAIKLWNLKV